MCRIARLCPGCENAVAEQPFAGCAHVLPPRLHPVSKAPSCPRYSPSPHRRWISLFPRFRFAVSSFHWRSTRQRAPSGKRHRYITVSRRIRHLNDIASTVIPRWPGRRRKGGSTMTAGDRMALLRSAGRGYIWKKPPLLPCPSGLMWQDSITNSKHTSPSSPHSPLSVAVPIPIGHTPTCSGCSIIECLAEVLMLLN